MTKDRDLPEYNSKHYFKPSRLTAASAAIVAEYYERKYGVKIYVVLHKEHLFPLMEACKREYEGQDSFKVGFIVPNNKTNSSIGHVSPMIFEKVGERYQCFVSDSIATYDNLPSREEFGSVGVGYYRCMIDSTRQADEDSCMTDAMVWLKDGLRLEGSFSSHAYLLKGSLLDGTCEDADYLFLDPQDLHKTVQVTKYLESNTYYINAIRKYGYEDGKSIEDSNKLFLDLPMKTTSSGLTLSQKRAKHTKRDEASGKDRNEFLAAKIMKYMQIVEDEYNSYTKDQLNSVLRKHQGLELLEGGGGSVASSLTKEEQMRRAAMLGHFKEYVELSEVKDGRKDEFYIKLNTERKQRHKLGRV